MASSYPGFYFRRETKVNRNQHKSRHQTSFLELLTFHPNNYLCRMAESIELRPDKKIYFASDFHLGAPDHQRSLERERNLVNWLDQIKSDAQVLFLMGDLFDFWFEYKSVVPKGYVRLLGKLAELSDHGVKLYIFPGNHDFWMLDYFEQELGAKIIHQPTDFSINERSFYIGHGDGLGPGDTSYKLLKKLLFANPVCQWLFRYILPPDVGQFLGNLWARNSYQKNRKEDLTVEEIDINEEFIYQHIIAMEGSGQKHEYYVFGHRHIAIDMMINKTARYINLGDWIRFNSYAFFDGKNLQLIIQKQKI
jgi:UDP-2,3-diacylglucosamine hydrolase